MANSREIMKCRIVDKDIGYILPKKNDNLK
jgi:hypothetical protein